jgi:hypothetical protein
MKNTNFRENNTQSNGNSKPFRRNILPPFSWLKSKPRKQPARSECYLFELLFNPEEGDNTFIRNVDELLDYMPSHSTL